MSKKNANIEVIARGLMVGSRGVLLCRSVGEATTFLPGGHVEPGETASAALARELAEELGVRVTVESFLGVIEHSYQQDDVLRHEINLVFEITHGPTTRRAKVGSADKSLEFLWQPLHMLADTRLLPRSLPKLIQTWSLGKSAPWTSDMTTVK